MNELALFIGGGGGAYASQLLGHRIIAAVEIDPFCRQILFQRQRDGVFPHFPIWDDIRTFDGKPFRGHIDIISGGFPCQDISVAGTKKGLHGEKSGLWKEMARVIGEIRPRFAFIENTPRLAFCGLDQILCDFAAGGYDAEWLVMGAHHLGAPHERERIWVLAHLNHAGTEWRSKQPEETNQIAHAGSNQQLEQQERGQYGGGYGPVFSPWDETAPDMAGMVHGLASRSQRTRALGNGQVPAVAATAFRLLKQRLLGG